MKFREKYLRIPRADIYVIQECENPHTTPDKYYREFAENSLWTGDNPNKGLGVFARRGIKLDKLAWQSGCLSHFLPVRIDEKFNILAVWARPPYIEDYCIYQSINIQNYNRNTVVLGDFGTNVCFDKRHAERTHKSVVDQLHTIGLESVYHNKTGEIQGQESVGTFMLRKHTDIPYHFSFCFADPSVVSGFDILANTSRLSYSAHFPIVIDIDTEKFI